MSAVVSAPATTPAAAAPAIDLTGPKGAITTYTPPADAEAPAAPAEGATAAEAPAEGTETPPPAAAAAETPLQRAQRVAAAAKRAGARNRELMAARAAAEQRAQETTRQLEQERSVRAQNEALQARLRDPAQRLAAMREMGLSAEEVVKQAIADGSPDAEVKRALARVQELETRLRNEEQQRQVQATTARAQQAQTAFVTEVGNAELYPILSAQPPSVVLSAAKDVIAMVAKQRGQDAATRLTNADIAEFLEWQYSSHAKAKSPSSAAAPPKASTEAAHASGSTAPKTLTNGHAAATHSGPLKRDDMSEVQKRAADIALLEKLSREAAKAG